ncbi:hypothetical protein I3J27_32165 [Bradyrhizobium xenonodulans]|uniref:Uncharacterized protein n=1 Tax=Bradyrhizobium xenonodulans TaxID=2736875 RepID=A0ABY7MJ93_9BRAD|nr:E2 domain-containing protein [Bradyrhizobium xenonodulans]WBL77628.1 hypothetical protein I3J27_32165 [Bradyrhizobium xenonodulans]
MALDAIADTVPPWAEFRRIGTRAAEVDAVLVRSSGAFTRLFELEVLHLAAEVTVYERVRGKTLPTFCPERHINADGSFCLGLRAGQGINSATAATWWTKLHAFLLCQETAAEAGLWPSGAQLSHGDAGDIEFLAEQAAAETGASAAYRDAVEFGIGPIAAGLSRINKATGRLRNGRSPCLCGRKHRTGKPLLRRECQCLGCPIELEFERRAAVDRFWRSMSSLQCCGTMLECPLKAIARSS